MIQGVITIRNTARRGTIQRVRSLDTPPRRRDVRYG